MPRAATETPARWDRHAIAAEIKRRGMTLKGLSARYKIGSSTCRLSLVRPSPTGDAAIAHFLGRPLFELWPDRYDRKGNRLVPMKKRLAAARKRKRPRRAPD